MILNEKKIIQVISDFLSAQIKYSKQENFLVMFDNYISDTLAILLCEEARKKCGADIFVLNNEGVHDKAEFDFAQQIILPSENFLEEILSFSEHNKCINISPLNIEMGRVLRRFGKHQNFADVYPLLDLHFSECLQLCKHLGREFEDEPKYNDVEFCAREDAKNGILSSNESPLKHKEWFKYTSPQRKLIAKLHQRDKETLHKDLSSFPYPALRDTGYVR